MKAVNILWDVDDPEDLQHLPKEIEIPEELIGSDGSVDDDEVSDYLSDFTGFCHKGFSLED